MCAPPAAPWRHPRQRSGSGSQAGFELARAHLTLRECVEIQAACEASADSEKPRAVACGARHDGWTSQASQECDRGADCWWISCHATWLTWAERRSNAREHDHRDGHDHPHRPRNDKRPIDTSTRAYRRESSPAMEMMPLRRKMSSAAQVQRVAGIGKRATRHSTLDRRQRARRRPAST